jgi:tetratricopeptide (TPR) repeat protein
MTNDSQFSLHLNAIIREINTGQFLQADLQLNGLINAQPNNVQLWYLKANCTFMLARFPDCEFSINKALTINPNHIPTLLTLVKLQTKANFLQDGVDTCNKILKLDNNHVEALFFMGTILLQLNRSNEAESFLERLVRLTPKNVDVTIVYGQSLLDQDKDSAALRVFNLALGINPLNISALNNKALALKKLCVLDEAIVIFNKALSIRPEHTEIIKNLASCYMMQGQIKLAKSLYKKAISLNELDKDAHHWLNKLLWENKDKEFLKSYEVTLQKHPKNTDLLFDLGHKLNLAGDLNRSKSVLEDAIKSNNHHTPSIVELSVVLRELNDIDKSLAFSQLAHKQNPYNVTVMSELGKSLISSDRPAEALEIFNTLIRQQPQNQSWIAYKLIALKLLGSTEYDYLCNYDHVFTAELSLPSGFNDLNSFNKELINALRQYHHAKTNPLDQSLVTGSQTTEKLFDYHIPIIQALRSNLREQTTCFFSTLKKDNKHPLLSRLTDNFIETDSWSVILNNNGYHKNHHHPAGWYSGPYYAQVPDVVNNESKQEGWVKFGQPGFNMATQLEPDKLIKPIEGLFVRFPSYFWHGTVPFSSNQERITVPCDMIPV